MNEIYPVYVRKYLGTYCALGAFGSDEGADAPQNACVVRRLPDHARTTRGVVPGRGHPVFGAVGAHGVLGNALKKRTTQTKIEKQRPQAPKNGFRFAMAPLLTRSGRCKNVPRVRRASPFRLRRSRNGQRTFNLSHFCTTLRYKSQVLLLYTYVNII